jgi:hypothetical protein
LAFQRFAEPTGLTDELDEQTERRAYWAAQPPADRIAEVESLRRLWIEITGDPDLPIVRVVNRHRLGDPAIQPPGQAFAHSAVPS